MLCKSRWYTLILMARVQIRLNARAPTLHLPAATSVYPHYKDCQAQDPALVRACELAISPPSRPN